MVRGQVVAKLPHCRDGPGVHLPARPRAGAEGLDAVAAVDAGERLGHLAAVRVLDADEQDPLHAVAGVGPLVRGDLAVRHYFFSSASTAPASFGSSGLTADLNRPTTCPSLPIRNFSKFQPMSPAYFGLVSFEVRYWYNGSIPAPLTTTLDIIGKVTWYLPVQNFSISSLVPGSCPPNSLAGTPITTRPWSLCFSYRASRPSYWG